MIFRLGMMMENKETALLIIEKLKLKPKRKCLAETAEYLMLVDTFRYEDVCKTLNITRDIAYNRINSLKKRGFVFRYLSKTAVDGGRFSLVDCRERPPKKRKASTELEESTINLTFVDKSSFQMPEYHYLWKIALGLTESNCFQRTQDD